MSQTISKVSKTSFLQGVLLVLASILFAVLLAELVTRIFYKEKQTAPAQTFKTFLHETTEDRTLFYKPMPGADTIQNGVLNKINSEGFRDREFLKEKTPGIKRILFLGDSLVYGQDLEASETIPKQLEKKLIAGGEKVEVLNFGVMGYETTQEISFFKSVGLQYKPDLVILGFTPNDTRFASIQLNKFNDENKWHVASPQLKWGERIPNFLYRHMRLLQYLDREKGLFDKKEKWRFYLRGEKDIWHYVRDQNKIIEDASDSPYRLLKPKIVAEASRVGTNEAGLKTMLDFIGIDSYVMYSSHWNVSKKALLELRDLSKREGFELQVVIFPFLWDLEHYPLKPLHEFLESEISNMGIAVMDSLEAVKAEWTENEGKISLDGIHFNAVGAAAFSDYLKTEIEKKYFQQSENAF